MKHLMIFSIGPVQEFIATARRSRDLWYGSWMLSELSKAAAKEIGELSSPDDLIFPHPADLKLLQPGGQFNSPNKVVALVNDDPGSKAKKVHKAVDDCLKRLWMDAKTHIRGPYFTTETKQQIDDLLEFYWVSIPINETMENGYAEAREKAEMLMAARKTTRDFEQPIWSAGTPKSSLDGTRESVIPKTKYPERGNPNDPELKKANNEKIENLYKQYRARRGEQLSGVDLLKRLGRLDETDTPIFKSTSDMAALPFVQKFNQKSGEAKTLIEALRAKLPPDSDALEGVEEGLVFENRFADAFPLQEITNGQRADFINLLEKYAGKTKPNPYYALLAADGDFMGKVIDGHTKKDAHQRISESLAEFAQQAQVVVKKALGVPVYTGGDDVLAYLPLHTALGCANELQSTFGGMMSGYEVSDGSGGIIIPSLSVGIAIVHHLEPLSDALQLVRKAEKDAKAVEGKNGLAIILSKRSGVDRSISDKFGVLHGRLVKLIEYSRTGAVSVGTAYEFQELHRVLSKTGIRAEAKAREAIRIVERKRESGSDQQIAGHVKESFTGWIQAISLDELAREMIVAKELARTEEVAQ